MGKRKAPHTYKNNFWSKLRVSKDVTIKELAEMCGCGEKQMGFYFSGQQMPNDNIVKALCELLDVDFIKGQLEFQSAHLNWRADHPRKHVDVEREPRVIVEKAQTSCGVVCESVPISELTTTLDKDAVLDLIYGKVDRSVYRAVEKLLDGSK